MAILGLFKNAVAKNVGTSETTIYEAPIGLDSILIQLDIANTFGNGVQIDVLLEDVSEATTIYFVKNAPIPDGSTLKVIDGQKVVLEAGDKIKVVANHDNCVDVVASIIEDVNTIV